MTTMVAKILFLMYSMHSSTEKESWLLAAADILAQTQL